ncbi:four helix bundle protein [Paenimyroides tangerinum]|uniref:Four helix bundle protein n=1 Tax=Paenimyroides tangerinum TaxID=2488728 RepID=A0A3P3W5K5_9FLAO|nr:four helix bundle protein [Paenimyroides tangerinum]RRJ88919.1 four helix bundle protein [Paenimyroides tangerinum]
MKNFVEFEVYQKAIELTKSIFKLLQEPQFTRETAFSNQLKRAVISISNNIAEGSEYNNNNQFIKYLKIAKGSCAEVKSMLILMVELEFVSYENAKPLQDMSVVISQQLSNFISYLDRNRKKD